MLQNGISQADPSIEVFVGVLIPTDWGKHPFSVSLAACVQLWDSIFCSVERFGTD